jgi:hypothetical protein
MDGKWTLKISSTRKKECEINERRIKKTKPSECFYCEEEGSDLVVDKCFSCKKQSCSECLILIASIDLVLCKGCFRKLKIEVCSIVFE